MLRFHIILLLFAASCLSTPTRPKGDAGAGGDAMSFPDAGPVTGWDRPRIRWQTPVADLDGDGLDDAVFANSCTGCSDGPGIAIAYGRPDGFLDGYDQTWAITDLEPLYVHVGDFIGDERLDILLLGDDGQDTWVAYWKQTGYRKFEQGAAQLDQRIDCGGVDDAVPCFVTTARITGDNKGDVIYGDLDELYVMRLSAGWSNFSSAGATELPATEPFSGLASVFAMPSAMDGVDDLFVASEHNVLWYTHSGGNNIGFPPSELALSRSGNRGWVKLDLDGNASPDFFTTVLTMDSEFVVTAPPEGETPDMRLLQLADDPVDMCGACDPVEQYAVVQADADPAPDLVMLDVTVGEGTSLFVIPNLNANIPAETVEAAHNPIEQFFADLPAPRRLIAGDFDGDDVQEVWVFDSRLDPSNTRCFELRQGSPAGIDVDVCP